MTVIELEFVCQTSTVVFSKVYIRSFLTRSLIHRCHFVTDNWKKLFESLFGSLLNHLYRYINKNISVKSLSLICITSVLNIFYSLKNCSV